MADQNQNTQTPPPAANPVPPVSGEVNNDKLMGILSYLSILVIIPLLATKNRSAFLNFHVNQGVNLLIVEIIGWVILSVVGLWYLMNLWQLIILVLLVIGIINVSKNESKPLPVIGTWFNLVK
jgi:uncharacterized membrane protein